MNTLAQYCYISCNKNLQFCFTNSTALEDIICISSCTSCMTERHSSAVRITLLEKCFVFPPVCIDPNFCERRSLFSDSQQIVHRKNAIWKLVIFHFDYLLFIVLLKTHIYFLSLDLSGKRINEDNTSRYVFGKWLLLIKILICCDLQVLSRVYLSDCENIWY